MASIRIATGAMPAEWIRGRMRFTMLLPTGLLPTGLLLCACHSGPDSADVCSVDNVTPGTMAADINDVAWEAPETTWMYTGTSVQVNTGTADGWWVSLVAQTDHDGNTIQSQIDGDLFPIHVTLQGGEGGGFLTLYADGSSDSYSSKNAGGGELELLRYEAGDTIVGCFNADTATDAGDTATLSAASFSAHLSAL